ncbi:hypothetical protein PSQ19_15520 [Devosia algicola]|uniref:Uncharacterized protein n=1 Tax=Devosia algicola TaxID=3026418 RepID=A0ABY7YLU8_9HYPH|nr:hypothetical protein [Devosia algicola]WDR02065.1 hypothetical protein PSQ19_15520 [Devosia algicola]
MRFAGNNGAWGTGTNRDGDTALPRQRIADPHRAIQRNLGIDRAINPVAFAAFERRQIKDFIEQIG